MRLASITLASSYSSQVINVVISEKEEDYFAIKDIVNMDIMAVLSINLKLAHMTTQELIKILEMRNSGVDSSIVKEMFFYELRYI